MDSRLVRAFAIGIFAVGAATIANAQGNVPPGQGIDVGKWEYDAHCALCHGLRGAGEGLYPSFTIKTPANLATISKQNGGVFPFARVYETIDGRQEVQAHGPRDMPIWGRDYTAQSSDLNPYYNPESFVRAKILALTEYIYRLQEK